jgi:hypothetical protein
MISPINVMSRTSLHVDTTCTVPLKKRAEPLKLRLTCLENVTAALTREQRAWSHVITFVTCTLQLGEEHGRVLLPLLVVLAIAVALVVLLLAHGNTRDLESILAWNSMVNSSLH